MLFFEKLRLRLKFELIWIFLIFNSLEPKNSNAIEILTKRHLFG